MREPNLRESSRDKSFANISVERIGVVLGQSKQLVKDVQKNIEQTRRLLNSQLELVEELRQAKGDLLSLRQQSKSLTQ